MKSLTDQLTEIYNLLDRIESQYEILSDKRYKDKYRDEATLLYNVEIGMCITKLNQLKK